MSDWLRKMRNVVKKDQKQEELEDFILLQDTEENLKSDNKITDVSESEKNDVEPAFSTLEEMENTDLHTSGEDSISSSDFLEDTRSFSADELYEVQAADSAVDTEEDGSVYYTGENLEEETDYSAYAPKQANEEDEISEKIFFNAEDADISDAENFTGTIKPFFKKHKSVLVGIGVSLGVIVLISGLIMILAVTMDPLRGYSQVAVAKGNVIHSMNTEGTMSANARYAITSLVSGAVVKSEPEVGDYVSEGSVLYELDNTEAKLAVERAQNQLDRSKAIGSAAKTSTSKIYSTDTGTISQLNISSGSRVSAGQVVAIIRRSDDTSVSVISTVTGTVSSVNVRQGRSVTNGTLIASVTDEDAETTQKTNTYDQKSNELDLEAAKKQLENYTIKSPVSGIVTEKNTKAGDNVSMTNLENPMMVIVDMNSMKFTFQVDEYSIWEIETGQSAIINTDSIPNETFAGEVTRVASEGTVNEEGETMFDVDVTVDEPGNLKAGMKVSAKIILASSTNVMYLPEQALMEADGQNALVLVKESSVSETETAAPTATSDSDGASDEELAFPWIEVPKGCKLVTVRYGIADGTNVEIISGLELGNIVVFDPKRENKKLVSSTAGTESNNTDVKNNSGSDLPAATGAPASSSAIPSATSTKKPNPTSSVSDEEAKRQIQQKVKDNNQNNSMSL
ncbi:efflux RND transporter periplasmic adaptor subunit [Ructibacterium gallinarum]|uniref:HlyD family efflux transporter periplasmic adaptor subunit n=1 Tax=Ructibacterium gallinarum TaxID=2779355 RepID=A0A9D5R861_9FIRM|nr:HlyD family efflux transporter periplasmic adaptor subunit [Ructibacterium gallinarum]MBE5039640.1 HlyD family efflux transporter periplasmic adaptor subunit [Ructibacterium gallinarum]